MIGIEKLLKEMAKLLLAILLLIAIVFGLFIYHKQPLSAYCHGLAVGDRIEQVIERAHVEHLDVFLPKDNNRVLIFNHKSPFFRFVCQVYFEHGQLVDTEIYGAD